MLRKWIIRGGKRFLRNATLGQRIALASTVVMAGVTLFYSVALYYGFEWVELRLSGEHMADQLHAKVKALENNVAPQVNDGVWLYGDHPWTTPIPEEFNTSPLGFSEMESPSQALFVFRERIHGHDYILVKDQRDINEVERVMQNIVLLVAGLICLLGLIWGLIFYRIVMDPVKRLAQEVTASSAANHYRPIAKIPLHDDITILAECCDSALQRLHQALEREQMYTGDVSHEIRNPLNVIEGSLELLSDSELTDRQRRQLERARIAARDIHLLVDDFLAFARDSRGYGASEADTIPSLLQRIEDSWAAEAKKRGITFRVIPTHECTGMFPMSLLGSVINNLVRNAIHYTQQGEVVVRETPEGLTVTDSAGGIDSDEVVKMFQPFYRGRQASNGRDAMGYGLGLSIVQRVCQRCKWTLTHENVPGGSRFIVNLKGETETTA